MKATIFRGFGLDGKFYTFSACTNNPGWTQSPTNGYFYASDNGVPIVYNTDFQDRRLLNDYGIFKDFDTNFILPTVSLVAPLSFQIMVNPRAYNNTCRLLDLQTTNATNYIIVALIFGYINLIVKNGSTIQRLIATKTTTLNQWTNICCTHNGTTGSIYLNGVLNTSMTMQNVPSVPFIFAGIGTQNFNGFIDDVRIWNRVLNSTEINNNYKNELVGNESGLIRYYKMNNNINDSTPNNAHGTNNNVKFSTIERVNINLLPTSISIVNNYIDYQNQLNADKDYNLGDCFQCLPSKCYKFVAKNSNGDRLVASRCCTVPQWIETSPGVFKPGDNGNVLISGWSSEMGQIIPCKTLVNRDSVTALQNYYQFNGTNSYLNMPAITLGSTFTFECWAYLKAKTQSVIFDFYNSLTNTGSDERLLFYYDLNSNSLIFTSQTGSGTGQIIKKNAIQLNTWTHLTIVYNGNIGHLIINGILIKSSPMPTIPNGNRGFHRLGILGSLNASWNGKLTDFRIWKVSIPVNDIKKTYKNLPGLTNVNDANLLVYYPALETTGTTAIDLSGNNKNAPLVNVTRFNTNYATDNCSGCLKKQCYAFLSIDEDFLYLACCDNPIWLVSRSNPSLVEPGDGTKYLRSTIGWESTAGKILKLKNQDEFTQITANKSLIVGNCDNCLKIDTYPKIIVSRIDVKLPEYNTFSTNYESINVFNDQVQFVGSDAEIAIEYEKLSESDKLVLENFYYFSDNESFYLPLEILLIPSNIQAVINSWKTKTFKFKSEPIIKPYIMNKNYQLYDVSIVLISNID